MERTMQDMLYTMDRIRAAVADGDTQLAKGLSASLNLQMERYETEARSRFIRYGG